MHLLLLSQSCGCLLNAVPAACLTLAVAGPHALPRVSVMSLKHDCLTCIFAVWMVDERVVQVNYGSLV
jgi:hypothetical protein